VLSVVMEESGFGSSAAAPVARRVLEGIAAQEGVPLDVIKPVTRAAGTD